MRHTHNIVARPTPARKKKAQGFGWTLEDGSHRFTLEVGLCGRLRARRSIAFRACWTTGADYIPASAGGCVRSHRRATRGRTTSAGVGE